jgi:hypothetical protein
MVSAISMGLRRKTSAAWGERLHVPPSCSTTQVDVVEVRAWVIGVMYGHFMYLTLTWDEDMEAWDRFTHELLNYLPGCTPFQKWFPRIRPPSLSIRLSLVQVAPVGMQPECGGACYTPPSRDRPGPTV